MSQPQKDREAETAIKAVIFALFGPELVERIAVFPGEDQAGEPGLSVTIFLKSGQKRMSGRQLLDTISATATALRDLEDYRFPFVTFLSLEDESAEDTLSAASNL